MHLIIDTETTGLIDFNKSNFAESQPHMLSLAILQLDVDLKEVASFYTLVKPDGKFTVPEDATKVHGITTETAQALGISCGLALRVLDGFCEQAKVVVAHNIDYDRRIVQIAADRHLGNLQPHPHNRFYCTMKAMTPICKIEHSKKSAEYKWPKLHEAYKTATGKDLEGAHNALADARATADIYRYLVTK